jgi:uncharacterized oxidoreductase
MARSRIGSHDRILITGGNSGIGAGLAAAMHGRGATVTIAGRDRGRLDAAASRYPGMRTLVVDVSDPASVDAAAAAFAADSEPLTVLVNNAGVQRLADFTAAVPPRPEDFGSEIATNLTGLVHVTAAFLPVLRRAPRARLVNVSSGLAFVPLVTAPVYSATKAAVRSFTVSLRRQLAGSTVQVVELIPPIVQTDLHRHLPEPPPMAMGLDAFVAAAMKGLDAGRDEIAVGLARPLRFGARVAPSRFLDLVNRG